MFEYHGWVTLRADATTTDDESSLRLDDVRTLLEEFSGYALMDLQAFNGDYYIHFAGHPNRRGTWGAGVIDLFTRIGRLARGSYGLLYVHDDEDAAYAGGFRVFRMARGLVTVHADALLSPVVPILEDG
ncbi:Imm7 family immunity protein [Nocardia sp. NPDC052254]|uniref:Imm7 family immunity protein n=1 Tax=Nocardia sp. NPDC052254 TaxID=3155681 RepID=UPI003434C153